MITHVVKQHLQLPNGRIIDGDIGAWEDFNSANAQALGKVRELRCAGEISIVTVGGALVVCYRVTREDELGTAHGVLGPVRRYRMTIEAPSYRTETP